MKKTLLTLLATALVSLLFTLPLNAGGIIKRGDLAFHYSAFGSTFLTPNVAKSYGLKRSRYNGIVNISVLNEQQSSKATSGTMTGTATNLLGNKKTLQFREIKEGEAIYYIAEFGFSNEETFTFNVTYSDNNQSHSIQFRQIFYAD